MKLEIQKIESMDLLEIESKARLLQAQAFRQFIMAVASRFKPKAHTSVSKSPATIS